jgi:hypothetical protein
MQAAVPEPSLRELVNLLSVQALLAMGMPHPVTQEVVAPNPQVARFYVDLIALLKDKTEGHRTEAETRELEDMLFQLRMRAMNLQPGAPNAAGFQGA